MSLANCQLIGFTHIHKTSELCNQLQIMAIKPIESLILISISNTAKEEKIQFVIKANYSVDL